MLFTPDLSSDRDRISPSPVEYTVDSIGRDRKAASPLRSRRAAKRQGQYRSALNGSGSKPGSAPVIRSARSSPVPGAVFSPVI